MSVLSLLMLQNRESHPVANRKNGRGAPLTVELSGMAAISVIPANLWSYEETDSNETL